MIKTAVYKKNKAETEREVKVMRDIGTHPNIVKFHRVIHGARHFCIAMELLQGGELFERICQLEKFTEEDARIVTKQLLEAIAFLHSKGVAHRDLKPENVIYKDPHSSANATNVIKITDFGFASFVDPSTLLTASCGTPLYVAPEVLKDAPYGVQCDMWSLGVIVYVLLCGFPPFYGDDDDELFHAIKTADYDFPSPYWDPISSNAKRFLQALFEIEPRKRLTAADALKHPWLADVVTDAPSLSGMQIELKKYQCKRKLIKGVWTVIATNRLQRVANQ